MSSRVIFTRGQPSVCRVIRAPTSTRNMSLMTPFGPFAVSPRHFGYPTSSLPFQPWANSIDREVAPLFRLMDDMSRQFDQHFLAPINAATASVPFAPRFDVREVDGAYELRGEIPGVEAKDLQVEFTAPTTLVIRGKVESQISNTPQTIAAQTTTVETPQDTKTVEAAAPTTEDVSVNTVADDAASTHSSSSYVKPTVEDEVTMYDDNATIASTPGAATPAESVVADVAPATQATPAPATEQPAATDNAHSQYHITERRTGSFQRVFNFPGRIDQEGVTATLKNGVLEVRVPKVEVQRTRRILVQ